MSIKRMSAVWEHSQHKGSELLLMLAIADTANDLGVAWPGYPYLAKKIRMARRSAIRLAATCAESGELWILNRSHRKSNIYIVTVGLSNEELRLGAEQALKMGAVPPSGSDILSPPPQVLAVTSCHYEGTTCHHVVIPATPKGDTAMAPDPSLPVITLPGEEKDDLASLWLPVLAALQGTMTKAVFEDVYRSSKLVSAENGTWIVAVPPPANVVFMNAKIARSKTLLGAVRAHAPHVQEIQFITKESANG